MLSLAECGTNRPGNKSLPGCIFCKAAVDLKLFREGILLYAVSNAIQHLSIATIFGLIVP